MFCVITGGMTANRLRQVVYGQPLSMCCQWGRGIGEGAALCF